jgi:hypothetical protein
MAHDDFRDVVLIRTLSELVTDFSDLVQKQLRLARAEISQKINEGLHAAIWMALAVLLGFVAVLLLAEGAALALAKAGLALHWSCFLIAAILAAGAALAFYAGRAGTSKDLSPARSIRQLNEAVRTLRS